MERLVIKAAEDTELAKFLHARVVGQEPAVATIVGQFNKLMAEVNDPSRPISSMLFLGPTGVGKTKLVESFCEYLFGENQKPLVINCGEFSQEYDVAKLLGSPSGYIGYGDKPRLAKCFVEDRKTKDGRKLQVILFDEIEKAKRPGTDGAQSTLFNLLLSVLDRGALTLANGEQVSFTDCIIFMTSNLGARELLACDNDAVKMKTTAEEVARKFFSPEQFNRIDEMTVFNALKPEQITLITDLEVVAVAERAKVEIDIDDRVRDSLVQVGYDVRYGARELKRAVDRFLTRPLAQFLAEGSIRKGNRLRVEFDDTDQLAFYKLEGMALVEEKRTSFIPVVKPTVAEQQFRNQGYVRNMLDRKFKYGDSHGAKIYQVIKKSGFAAVTPEFVLSNLQAQGWTTDNASPLAAVKYVLHDWTKKNWAVKIGERYQVKE